jgi:hypothetical protein
MLHKFLITAFVSSLLALGFSVKAQTGKMMPGSVVDKTTNMPVRMASITNISLGKTVVSRTNGTFELEMSAGNIIAFMANGYYSDTIVLKQEIFNAGNLLITLSQLPATLAEVTVTGNYNKYQVDSIERRKNFLENVGASSVPAISRANESGFGIGLNLDRFSKKQKQERKARDIFAMMEEEAYVNFRWNEEIVKKYSMFQEDELIAFMERNRPQYGWLRKNPTEEALMYYINSSLKKEKKKKG